MSLKNTCSDIIHKIMDYMDIAELNKLSIVCKNFNNDSEYYVKKYKKETNLKSLTDKHTCRNCTCSSYNINRQFCTDCFLRKCDNCYSVRNCLSEFVKYTIIINGIEQTKHMCQDYCMFKCHMCNFVDTRPELFLNNNIEIQTICLNCFEIKNETEKKNYDDIYNDDWDDLDNID